MSEEINNAETIVEAPVEETVETPITTEMTEDQILEESPADVAPVVDSI